MYPSVQFPTKLVIIVYKSVGIYPGMYMNANNLFLPDRALLYSAAYFPPEEALCTTIIVCNKW